MNPPRRRMNRRTFFSWAGIGLGAVAAGPLILAGAQQQSVQQEQVNEDHAIRNALEHPKTFNNPAAVPEPAAAIPPLGPSMVTAPSVGMRLGWVSLGRDNRGDLQIPKSSRAALFNESAPIDASTGTSLLAAHVNGEDGTSWAPFHLLSDLQAGSRIITSSASGVRADWVVTTAEVIKRADFTRAYWTPTGPRRLVLVTCAGTLSASTGAMEFQDNLVITAVPVQ